MGVTGAALATVISQLASGLWCLLVLLRRFPVLRMTPDDRRLRPPFIRRLMNMGLPFGLQYSITAIGTVMVTASVNDLGTIAVAAVTAAGKLSMLFNIVIDALASALATFSGQNVGARKLDRVHQGLKSASIVGSIYCILALVVIIFFGQSMIGLFVDADDPRIIQDILAKAQQFLVVNGALYIPLLFVNLLRFTIQGVGFTTVAMTAGVMELIGRGAVAVLLVPIFGYDAAVWANPVAWLMADLFLFPCYITVMKWLRNRLKLTGQLTQSPKEYARNAK
jgi:Na+-driven multidrug efflux pump